MTKVVLDISLSEPLGQDGQRLHAWADEGDAVERVPNPVSSIGALIAGRRTYVTSLPWWGAGGPHPPIPVFVVTRRGAAAPEDSV